MLSELQVVKCTHYFDLWDLKHDGFWDYEEYFTLTQRIAKVHGFALGSIEYQQLSDDTQARWREVLILARKNHQGKVTLSEWLARCEISFSPKPDVEIGLDKKTELLGRFVFNMLDTDGDGLVSAKEWGLFVSMWGIPDPADGHFRQMDVDGDGYLSLRDFNTLLHQFYFGVDPKEPGTYLFGNFDKYPLSPPRKMS